ncbi:hypothetical protein B7463_g6058, partial [Scytalidium lignicola]
MWASNVAANYAVSRMQNVTTFRPHISDRKRPRCGRCLLLNEDCLREPAYRFLNSTERNSDTADFTKDGKCVFEYDEDQIWVETPKNVEFVLEDPQDEEARQPQEDDIEDAFSPEILPIQPTYQSPESSPCSVPQHTFSNIGRLDAATRSSQDSQSTLSSPMVDDGYSFRQISSRSGVSYTPILSTLRTVTISGVSRVESTKSASPHSSHSHSGQRQCRKYDNHPRSLSPLYGNSEMGPSESPWPLENSDEAMLIRHLSLTSGYDSYLADQYHRECLAMLIPMLDDRNTLLDEAVCAATVILRFFEEISIPLVGTDTQSHLLGTHVFVRAQEYRASGIRQAALRVALRQEITVAFSARQPVKLLTEYISVERSKSLTNDWDWTFRMTVLCAEVLNYCFCDNPKSVAVWAELVRRADSWMREKPSSFEPLKCIERRPPDRVFPEIWLLNDCHVAAHIYYLMCHILLTAYNPARPQIGPDRTEATRIADAQETVKDAVRKICGIAITNRHVVPPIFKACSVISMCGDFFIERTEQQALLDVLVTAQVDLAWPTTSSQSSLKEKWGWNSIER